MKKAFLTLAALLALGASAWKISASPASQASEYILENGMEVFLLEDSSDALVHVNFMVRAGFSSQTRTTNGFFTLYTNLVKSQLPELDSALCGSDFSSYQLDLPCSQLEQTLLRLSERIFALQFTDDELSSELERIKAESEENAKSMAGFINSAIDSKIFAAAPWQHDSGIYPQIFSRTTKNKARTILQAIAQKWYIPKNSAIFISGNFSSEKVLSQIRSSFGRFYSSYPLPSSRPSEIAAGKKRFVLHNPEFSEELTQLVVQFTGLTSAQSELAAAALNLQHSALKARLLENASLNIPGDEYVHVAAAHKRDISRLIIQSLLQKPGEQGKKSGISSLVQAENFLREARRASISADEANYARRLLLQDFSQFTSNPRDFMQKLSEFWAMRQHHHSQGYAGNSEQGPLTILEEFMAQPQKILGTDLQDIQKQLEDEPFVFVIINSADYKKNKSAYAAAGFEEITIDKASWYSQEMYKEIRNQLEPDDEPIFALSKDSADNDYFLRNMAQLATYQLENGIILTAKRNTNSTDVSLLISIKGGELNSASNHGFEEVMVHIMAGMIQKEIQKRQASSLIGGKVSVNSATSTATSSIVISCVPQDFEQVCSAATNAIIFGEIPPALADRAVSSRQYKKRLENGSAVRQLYSAAISAIFGRGAMTQINDTSGDILQTTDYKSILQAYPEFLDASRFSLILTGDFAKDAPTQLQKEFGLLAKNKRSFAVKKLNQKIPESKTVAVKIAHTFLTDVPAEKAGPMPAVLVPTTEFLDPVIYVLKAPEPGSKDYPAFSAILNYLEGAIQKELDDEGMQNQKASVQLPMYNLSAGFITVQNVAHLKECESIYKKCVQRLLEQLTSPAASSGIIPAIKNQWTKNQLAQTATNEGTAALLQKGIELFPDAPLPEFYLKLYDAIQNAGPQDFIDAMKYFPPLPPLRIISKDTKN